MLPNRELVVYCLYLAGGATKRVHTEDLALKCWELYPDSFSWTKFTQFPDKDIVRVALTDARKDKHGAHVAGRVEGNANTEAEPEGWTLTERGLGWIKDNLELFGGDRAKHERKTHRQILLRRVKELTSHELFRRFEQERGAFSPGIGELAAFLRCRVDASPAVWERRMTEIKRLGTDADDDRIARFTSLCWDAYDRER